MQFIWEDKAWPRFTWDAPKFAAIEKNIEQSEAHLNGILFALGFNVQAETAIEVIAKEIQNSYAIEGEKIEALDLRSSIAQHLGAEHVLTANALELVQKEKITSATNAIVAVSLDAIKNCNQALTKEKLCAWHTHILQYNTGGFKIQKGEYRKDTFGPMRVISGSYKNEYVHFIAPPASYLEDLMNAFYVWFNQELENMDVGYYIKSAIAHLYFITIHPFEDGNGRMARILSDMVLSKKSSHCGEDFPKDRLYSISAEIIKQKKRYYEILERTQKGNLDISEWLEFYLDCIQKALASTELEIKKTLARKKFWQKTHEMLLLNARQKNILTKMLGDWEGSISSSKWAQIAKCSQDTAGRDINALVQASILVKNASSGRSTSYSLNESLLSEP